VVHPEALAEVVVVTSEAARTCEDYLSKCFDFCGCGFAVAGKWRLAP
jgi:hypothetical protein